MKRSLWLLTLGALFTTLNLPVAGHDLLADWLGYLLFALGVMGLFPGEGRTPSNPALFAWLLAGTERAAKGLARDLRDRGLNTTESPDATPVPGMVQVLPGHLSGYFLRRRERGPPSRIPTGQCRRRSMVMKVRYLLMSLFIPMRLAASVLP